MCPDTSDITALLRACNAGDANALRRLVDRVYPELRRVARRQLRRSRRDPALDTTGLVHEAYIKLAEHTRGAWNDRGHFFAVAAQAMRQILVDAARERLSAKRGRGRRPEVLDEGTAWVEQQPDELLSLDAALDRLSAIDPRLTRVVECRYFAGYTELETGRVLGISRRTVQREWTLARSWLRTELSQ